MAEPITRKTLELKMTVVADTAAGNRALQELARSAEKVEMAMGKAQRSMGGGVGSVGGSGAAAAGGAGGLGGIGSAAAVLATGAAIAATSANLVRAYQQLDNSLLTTREKVLGFAAAIPVIGTALSGLISNVSSAFDRLMDPGTAKALDQLRMTAPIRMAQDAAAFGQRRREHQIATEGWDATYGRYAVEDNPTIGSQLARGMGAGPISGAAIGLFRDRLDPRLMAAHEGINLARRGVAGARYSADESARQAVAATDAARSAVARSMSLRGGTDAELSAAMNPGGVRDRAADRGRLVAGSLAGSSGFGRIGSYLAGELGSAVAYAFPSAVAGGSAGSPQRMQKSYLEEQQANNRAALALAEAEARVTENKAKQLELARRIHELSRAETALVRTQADIAAEKEAKVRGFGTQFGLMDESRQMAVLSAAQRFAAGGRGGVTQAEIDLLSGTGVTSEFVGRRVGSDSEANPIFKQLLALTGQQDAATLAEERKRLRADFDLKVQFDEEQFARLLEEKLRGMDIKDLLGEIVRNQFKLEMRRPELDALRGRIERGGP